MPRGNCTFKQRDLQAALKAVGKSGAAVARVEVKPDGTIVVVMGDPPATVPDIGTADEWLEK
jgi:hypothetical protein